MKELKVNKLSLKLFNAVLVNDLEKNIDGDVLVNNDYGFVMSAAGKAAEQDVIDFFKEKKVSGADLNKTFHKSWKKVQESDRYELLIHQILHYFTTYGALAESDYVYIPNEVLDIPDLDKLSYKVVLTLTKDEMVDKSLSLLNSGIALKEETLRDVFSLLKCLDYKFTGDENIKNKEALILLADLHKIYPKDPVDVLRYVVFKSTGSTLLIKNKITTGLIKDSDYNPSDVFNSVGLEKMATIFNRFKSLFLAYKNTCPKVINKISKLSKKHHQPLVSNPLMEVTVKKLSDNDLHWLENATVFSLFKALNVCHLRLKDQDVFNYSVRNGFSYVKRSNKVFDKNVLRHNFKFILDFLRKKVSVKNKDIYIPEGVSYGLPTSEKMFVGNIPFGTKISAEKLAVGVYWENDWGATDLDLSTINVGGKLGWNSNYYDNSRSLTYSGDWTYADDGAVEYFYAQGNISPSLLFNNIYSGNVGCQFNLIVGIGDDVKYDYMMNPNNLLVSEKSEMKKRAAILGLLLPSEKGGVDYVVFNVATTQNQVSSYNEISGMYLEALCKQFNNQLMLDVVLKEIGFNFVDSAEKANIDLSLDKLDRETFIKIFK